MSRLSRLGVVAAFVLVPVVVFWTPLHNLVLAMSFGRDDLRRYEKLFEGEAMGPQGDDPPPRTGKVILVRPSTHNIFVGGVQAQTVPWTALSPGQRDQITREVDPPGIDDAWFELDPSIRAASPDEVDTVIFCEHSMTKVGEYVRKGERMGMYGAFRRDAVLKAYDRKSGRFLGACLVEGPPPPETTRSLDRHSGKPPPIARAVAGMPLK